MVYGIVCNVLSLTPVRAISVNKFGGRVINVAGNFKIAGCALAIVSSVATRGGLFFCPIFIWPGFGADQTWGIAGVHGSSYGAFHGLGGVAMVATSWRQCYAWHVWRVVGQLS